MMKASTVNPCTYSVYSTRRYSICCPDTRHFSSLWDYDLVVVMAMGTPICSYCNKQHRLMRPQDKLRESIVICLFGLSMMAKNGEDLPDLFHHPRFQRSKRWRVSIPHCQICLGLAQLFQMGSALPSKSNLTRTPLHYLFERSLYGPVDFVTLIKKVYWK